MFFNGFGSLLPETLAARYLGGYMKEVTRGWLDKGKSDRGGWNRSQLVLLGESWPPKAGWVQRVIGREITDEDALMFEQFGKVRQTRKQRRLSREASKVLAQNLKAQAHKATPVNVSSDAFLSSYEWRKVRMQALKMYGPRCQCCGATPADGAVMNVDHIKPRKLYPDLALDVNNLQVLCAECNHGKGNWDTTDWRK